MGRRAHWLVHEGTLGYDGRRNTVALSKLWSIRILFADARDGKHDIYWGCHACDLPVKHVRKCVCSCGASPGKFSMFWGNDFIGFDEKEMQRRRKGLTLEDGKMTEVTTNLKETIVNGRYSRKRRANVQRTQRGGRRRKKTGYS